MIKIKIDKTDWGRFLSITIGKYQLVIGFQDIKILQSMHGSMGSLDSLFKHQHNKYEHD